MALRGDVQFVQWRLHTHVSSLFIGETNIVTLFETSDTERSWFVILSPKSTEDSERRGERWRHQRRGKKEPRTKHSISITCSRKGDRHCCSACPAGGGLSDSTTQQPKWDLEQEAFIPSSRIRHRSSVWWAPYSWCKTPGKFVLLWIFHINQSDSHSDVSSQTEQRNRDKARWWRYQETVWYEESWTGPSKGINPSAGARPSHREEQRGGTKLSETDRHLRENCGTGRSTAGALFSSDESRLILSTCDSFPTTE